MNIDKAQLIPFLKGLAEGYLDPGYATYTGDQIAVTLEAVVERIEAGEFDEVCEYCNNTGYITRGFEDDVDECYNCDSFTKLRLG